SARRSGRRRRSRESGPPAGTDSDVEGRRGCARCPWPSRRSPSRKAAADWIGDRLSGYIGPGARATLLGGLQLLEYPLGEVQRFIPGDDRVAGGADVEDERVITRGANALDDAVDARLNRIEELPLPARGLLLQFLGGLLQLLLLSIPILPTLRPLGRAQHGGLRLEVLRGRIESGLELLHLGPIPVQLLREGRFRFGVAGRGLEDCLDVHEADPGGARGLAGCPGGGLRLGLGRGLLLRGQRRGGQPGRQNEPDPGPLNDKIAAPLPVCSSGV